MDPVIINFIQIKLESGRIQCHNSMPGFAHLKELLEVLVADLGPSLLYKLTGGTGDIEDIDLNAEYSDDDREIYFND